jgi:hypothetical protein
MEIWDVGYYGHLYNINCRSQRMTELQWPTSKCKWKKHSNTLILILIQTRKILYPSVSL